MLICWLDNTISPTWGAVAEALDRMEQGRVADEIRKTYIISTTAIEGTDKLELTQDRLYPVLLLCCLCLHCQSQC